MIRKKLGNKGEVNIVGIVIAIIIIAIIAFAIWFLLTHKLGLGGGNGNGLLSSSSEGQGDGNESQNSTDENTEEVTSETVATETTTEAGNVNEVTIKIKEDKVWVNEKEIADKETLKAYLEEINNDDKKYTLEQENAILATYNWVVEVLDDLKIEYTELKTETIED